MDALSLIDKCNEVLEYVCQHEDIIKPKELTESIKIIDSISKISTTVDELMSKAKININKFVKGLIK